MEPARRKAIHDAMVRLSDGDRSALQSLLDDLWPVILAFAQRSLGHPQDAEDVAQEVFLRICSRISDFDHERDGLSWAFGIASYEIMTQRRRQRRRREIPGVMTPAVADRASDPAPSQEEAVMTHQLATMLASATGALSDHDRVALGLVSGPALTPTAGPALRKRRQRALDRLRSVWRRLHGEP